MSRTSGPWRVEECGHYEWCVRGPDGPPNIEGGLPTEQWVARECPSVEDARLIAAAPDLLRAVWKMLNAHDRITNSDYDVRYREAIAALYKASEKAQGEP